MGAAAVGSIGRGGACGCEQDGREAERFRQMAVGEEFHWNGALGRGVSADPLMR